MILLRATVEADGNHIIHRPATPEEIKAVMPDAMHWLPMTEDAVFEDGKLYLLRDGEDGSYALAIWDSDGGRFFESWMSPVDKTIIGHYARITEPS